MKSLLFTILTALPITAYAATISTRQANIKRKCGNEDSSAPPSLLDLHDKISTNNSISSSSGAALTVPTWFHIVSSRANQNLVTNQMIQQQLAEMNRAYAPSGIQFKLDGTDRTINDGWAEGSQFVDEVAMKRALRKGTYQTLNIYFQSDLTLALPPENRLLGQCTFPEVVDPVPAPKEQYVIDGCKVISASMPGGAYENFNLGRTAVHEVGHWFGLFHPFEGSSCLIDGDKVGDTPVESEPSFGCPTAKDSCPDVSGDDPVNNYMDYADDACMFEFTAGQNSRANTVYNVLRAGK
jgi:hypothetical protein